jgi:hypothetical protein
MILSGDTWMGYKNNCIEDAVEKFFTAVALKDWDTFIKFINHNHEFYALLPGKLEFFSTEDFCENQKDWFLGKTGSFEFCIQEAKLTSGNKGTSTVNVTYSNIDPKGDFFEYSIIIKMDWVFDSHSWYLVKNINSIVGMS